MEQTGSRSLISRIFHLSAGYRKYLLALFFLNLLAMPVSLLKPFALKVLIDCGFGKLPVPRVISAFFPAGFEFTFGTIVIISVGLALSVALIENLNILGTWVLETFTGEKLVLSLKARLFNHIQRLSLTYHDRKGTADALYRLQWDTMSLRAFLTTNLAPLLSSAITLTSMLVVMFVINWRFALITLGIMPPMYVLLRLSAKKLKKDWYKVKDDESVAMSVGQEVLSSLRVVKAFGQEDHEGARFVQFSNKAVKGQVKMAWTTAAFGFGSGILFATGTALFIYLGGNYVHQGIMTLGELTMLLAYLVQIYGPLDAISKNINNLQSALASLERVFSLFDLEKEVHEERHAAHLVRAEGAFEFKNVSFSYNPDKKTLDDVSFTVNKGDRVGIMGGTGSGKTTLISLIMRFYDGSGGSILIDGADIRSYKLADYRKQFSMVLQEPVLFATTIAENIRYGKPDATEEEVVAAAKAANAHDFIMRCTEGYDTVVGERGMQLSGGERQRISIARAFIKDAPVLILDEPTSSLDVKTEAQIMEAMERLMEGRTTFMITHRLDTLNSCNVILHLEQGHLVDFVRNNSAELIEKKKLFVMGNS